AGDRGAVAAEELRGRVHDHVRAVLEGAQQEGGRDGVVHDQRDADLVGDVRDGAQVGDVLLRVGDRLDEEGAGGLVGRGPPGRRIGRVQIGRASCREGGWRLVVRGGGEGR